LSVSLLFSLLGPCLQAAGPAPAYLSELVERSRELNLAEAQLWPRLLHYGRSAIAGLRKSLIDDKAFFFSPAGNTDPRAELEATLAAFFAPEPADEKIKQHPQCAFPARYHWLKERLGFDPARLPEMSCGRFERWRSQMEPGSLTMIFASSYLNNPASMYGHTFLRLDHKDNSSQERLLDYTVNYYAVAETRSGIQFAVRSLLGGYFGNFSTLPYYMKVQEYNNIESRDIWEYRLRSTAEGRDRLVRHLWEVGATQPTYYFINRNCSYYLLPMLEVADPSLGLARQHRRRAIPVDTLRSMTLWPGLVTGVSWRPSHLRLMLARRERLSGEERGLAEALADADEPSSSPRLEALPNERQAMVLDSAYDLFRYRIGFSPHLPVELARKDSALLSLRHALGDVPSAELPVSAVPRPFPSDRGHRSARTGPGFGWTRKERFIQYSWRPALHDMEDDPEGFLPGSQVEMAKTVIRQLPDRGEFYLDRFTVVDIASFSSWDPWAKQKSWKVNFGMRTLQDLESRSEHSLAFAVNGGVGISKESSLWKREQVYALVEADAAAGQVLRDWYRFGGGVSGGVVADLHRFWRMHFSARYLNHPLGEPGDMVSLRLVSAFNLHKRFTLRASLERQDAHRELTLAAYWYF